MIKRIIVILLLLPLSAVAQNQDMGFKPPVTDPAFQLQKFNQFYRYLNGMYVDTINNARLIEDAIVKVLSELDPHSAYIAPKEMEDVAQMMGGSFSGIGIEFNILHDTLLVVNTIPGGPAEKVGLLPNDRIVSIDGQPAIGIKQGQVAGKLRGPKGTAVEIEVMRRGENEALQFRIVRDNIPINTIDAAYRLDEHTGYINVNRFAMTTMKEFDEAFLKLGKIDALVLDLRGNGGGILEQSVDMSNFFLKHGSAIVSTEGRMVPAERYVAKKDGKFTKGRLIVLIDESSASASEIVAGAIQDWDRGLIIGRRSFGKGLVQKQFPLPDGSAVRVTVARYHTPTGRAIQRPFVMGEKDDYYASLAKRFENGGDTIAGGDSLIYTTLVRGRKVYGGGGIFPDIYVPVDTTAYTDYWAKLVRRGVMIEWVLTYLDGYREKLESLYPNFESYEQSFRVDSVMVSGLIALGEKRGVPYEAESMSISGKRINLQIKALIAQKLWSMNEYSRVINSDDKVILRAHQALVDWSRDAASISDDNPRKSIPKKSGHPSRP